MRYDKPFKIIIRNILIGLLFIFIILYAHSRTSFLSQGVSLSVENLEDGQTIESRVLKLEGTAKRAVLLTINNREVLIDEKGNFKDTIILYPGLNLLVIEARDRFDNYKKLEYRIWHTGKITTQEIRENFKQRIYTEYKNPYATIDSTRIEEQEEVLEDKEITN